MRSGLIHNLVKRPQLERECSNDTRAVDMRERVVLAGDGGPSGATRRFDVSYFDLDIARALNVLIHLGAEEMCQFAFGYRLFEHGFAPFSQELTINPLLGKLSSPIGKQIVNVSQFVLCQFGCVSDRVRLLPVCCESNDTPVCFEAGVVNPRDTDCSYPIATGQSAKLLQDDQFKVFFRDKLFRYAAAPVRVATRALLQPMDDHASGNLKQAKKNVSTILLALQVVLFRQLDAATDYCASELRIVVIAAGHRPPAMVHGNNYDRFGLATVRLNPEHKCQPVSQIFCWLACKGRGLLHVPSTDQPTLLSVMSDGSTLSFKICSGAGPGCPTIFARDLHPANKLIFRCFPFARYGAEASFGKTLVQRHYRGKSISLGNSHCSRRVKRQIFRAQATDQVARFIQRAMRSSSHHRETVPGFQQANRIAHETLANTQRDYLRSGNGRRKHFAHAVYFQHIRNEGEEGVAA